MPKVKVSEFVEYVKSTVGNAYLWGGQGETLVDLVESLASKKGQSKSNTDKMFSFMKSNGFKDMRFFDCSGLAVYYLLKKKAITSDMTADMLYNKCDKISKESAGIGDWVFLGTSSKKTHIGYITGKNEVVHAYNQERGVIKEKLNSGRNWYYARPNFCIDFGSTSTESGKVTIDEYIKVYRTARDAELGVNSISVYAPGSYFIYKVSGKATNITKKKGTPGAWVVL